MTVFGNKRRFVALVSIISSAQKHTKSLLPTLINTFFQFVSCTLSSTCSTAKRCSVSTGMFTWNCWCRRTVYVTLLTRLYTKRCRINGMFSRTTVDNNQFQLCGATNSNANGNHTYRWFTSKRPLRFGPSTIDPSCTKRSETVHQMSTRYDNSYAYQ